MIKVSREKPEMDGNSISAKIRSTLRGLSLRTSQAFKPSGTAATDETRKTPPKYVELKEVIGGGKKEKEKEKEKENETSVAALAEKGGDNVPSGIVGFDEQDPEHDVGQKWVPVKHSS